MGGEAERRLHFRHGPPPTQGKGDAVSRVWALSPPGTTDCAAFGRRVTGARSVAWSPPPPSTNARHFCRRCPCAGPSSNPAVVSPQSAVLHVCGGGTQTPASAKAKEAPSPQRRGPQRSQSERGPLASAAGALVIPQRRRPPRLSGGGLGVRKRKRPPRLGGGLGDPTAKEAASPQRRGPRCPKAKEAPSPQRRGPW